jgi:long-chain acyl-CoA synthetase
LSEDGEVLVRGPGVARNYWPDGAPPTTADGYLHSGDLGRFDGDRFLYLVGRKSELIKTSTGRKIHPAAVASIYQRHPLLDSVIVFGDGAPCLVALIAVDKSKLVRETGGHAAADASAANEDVDRGVSEAIEEMAPQLAPHERIASFRVLKRPLTVESGELTPSLKICRPVVAAHFADEITAMYREVGAASSLKDRDLVNV